MLYLGGFDTKSTHRRFRDQEVVEISMGVIHLEVMSAVTCNDKVLITYVLGLANPQC